MNLFAFYVPVFALSLSRLELSYIFSILPFFTDNLRPASNNVQNIVINEKNNITKHFNGAKHFVSMNYHFLSICTYNLNEDGRWKYNGASCRNYLFFHLFLSHFASPSDLPRPAGACAINKPFRYSVLFTVESLSLFYLLFLYLDLYVLGYDALIS